MRVYKKPIAQNSVWSQLKGAYDGALILSKIGTAAGVLLLLIYCASNDTYPRGVGLGDVLSFVLVSSCFGLICGIFGGLLIYSGGLLIGVLIKIPVIKRKWPKHLKVSSTTDWWLAVPMFIFAILFEGLFIALSASTLTQAILWLLCAQIFSMVLYLFCSLPLNSAALNNSKVEKFYGVDTRIFNSLLPVFMLLVAVNSSAILRNGILNMTMRLANIRQDDNSIEIYLDAQVAKDLQLNSATQGINLPPSSKSMVPVSGIVLFGKIGSYTTIRATPVAKDYEFPLAQVDPRSLALIKKSKGENLQKLYLNKDYIQKKILQIAYKSPTDKRALEDGYVEIDNAAVVDLTEETLTVRAVPVDFVVEIPNDKIVVTKRLRNAAG